MNGPGTDSEDLLVALRARVEELEAKSAFQDETIQSLNDTVTELGRTLAELEVANRYLAGRLREVTSDGGTDGGFEVPPHY